ncbi:hypothetical protein RBIBE_17600 [Bacillus velezensis]|nr:hypothetical protein AVM03_03355 [Bacillus amyloliquefaciens]BET17770.1 hypothetical protein RBIBE_17600 [Bacillus velezensis]GJI63083.1 hypothetical protein BVSY1_22390 [Bacillus velezensis]
MTERIKRGRYNPLFDAEPLFLSVFPRCAEVDKRGIGADEITYHKETINSSLPASVKKNG